jgi:hypothetical protein
MKAYAAEILKENESKAEVIEQPTNGL